MQQRNKKIYISVEKEQWEQEKDLLCLFWMKIGMILLKL